MNTEAPERRQIHMNVPDELHYNLRRLAVEKRTSGTALVIEALKARYEELNAR